MANEDTGDNHTPLVAQIAWLSTCLLAAGIGTMMDPNTRTLWLRAGCFGLVAAVGLEGSARIRERRRQIKHSRVFERRCDRSLERFVTERETTDELRAAISQLLPDNSPRARAVRPGSEEPRWACNLPVAVYSVASKDFVAASETGLVEVVGRLDNLSGSGFGLILDEPLAAQMVIIAILPPKEQEFELLAEIIWCDPWPEGQTRAGGRLLRVLPAGSHKQLDWPSKDEEELPAEAAC